MAQTYISVQWANNTGAPNAALPPLSAYAAAPLLVDSVPNDSSTGYDSGAFTAGNYPRIAALYYLGTVQSVKRVTGEFEIYNLDNTCVFALKLYKSDDGVTFTSAFTTGTAGHVSAGGAFHYDTAHNNTNDFPQDTAWGMDDLGVSARYIALVIEAQTSATATHFRFDDFRIYGTDDQLFVPATPCAIPAAPVFTASAAGSTIKLTGTK